jgi:hypothetical protein
MFIGREHKHFSKIPKGLYVKIAGKYIQSLRDFVDCLALLSYKHKFPSGIIALTRETDLDNGQGCKPASGWKLPPQYF